MYSIEYYTGSAWVQLTDVSFEGVSIVKAKENDRIFSRLSVDGTITFYNSSYSTLLSLLSDFKAESRIKRGTSVVVEGFLNLLGKWDTDNKICELEFKSVDDYTDIFKVWDEEISLSGITNRTITLEVESEQKEVRLSRTTYPTAPTPENNYTEGTHTAEEWVFVKEMIDFPADGWDYDPDFT